MYRYSIKCVRREVRGEIANYEWTHDCNLTQLEMLVIKANTSYVLYLYSPVVSTIYYRTHHRMLGVVLMIAAIGGVEA